MKAINIEQFARQFAREYEQLYNADERGAYVAGYREAVDFFDELLKDHADFVGEFARYRGDIVTSDREAAAFSFALEALGALD